MVCKGLHGLQRVQREKQVYYNIYYVNHIILIILTIKTYYINHHILLISHFHKHYYVFNILLKHKLQ